MKILIKVTKEILKRSKMCGLHNDVVSENCAISLAVKDIFPNAFVGVDWDGDAVIGRVLAPGTLYIKVPGGRKFISQFDQANPIERVAMPEQVFEIDVPQEVIDKIGLSEVYKILSESKTLELVEP